MPNENPRKRRQKASDNGVAPGIDPDDSYGENATDAEIAEGDSTTVTRLVYDEYDHSRNDDEE
ncbi:hypothetical protein ACFSMW_11465 [Virgibacillus halophilus]|uniref:DUF4025 domain-containing protein n=1 Tax=Tigheibacillus halophilus TaxID=361280 RepID=A0ABU5C6R0_9BACI|nr:hypothetical protein [Virgibacillus halophilus]